jgi:hypothetical protein
MSDLVDIFLPAQPANKNASTEGEIHITHDNGRGTMVLSVPNREEVYKVIIVKQDIFVYTLLIIASYSIFWIVKRILIPILLMSVMVFALQMFLEEF